MNIDELLLKLINFVELTDEEAEVLGKLTFRDITLRLESFASGTYFGKDHLVRLWARLNAAPRSQRERQLARLMVASPT